MGAAPGGAMSEQLAGESPAIGLGMSRSWFDACVDRHGVMSVSGELDVATAPRFAVALDPLAEEGGIVSVDFSNLTFCGAAGITVLVGAVRTMADRGRLVIYDAPPMVTRLIEIAGLDSLVDVAVGRVISAPAAVEHERL
jgi:anti-anti-sigma factor